MHLKANTVNWDVFVKKILHHFHYPSLFVREPLHHKIVVKKFSLWCEFFGIDESFLDVVIHSWIPGSLICGLSSPCPWVGFMRVCYGLIYDINSVDFVDSRFCFDTLYDTSYIIIHMAPKCFIQVFISIRSIQIKEPSWLLIMPDKCVEPKLLIVFVHYPERVCTPSNIEKTLEWVCHLTFAHIISYTNAHLISVCKRIRFVFSLQIRILELGPDIERSRLSSCQFSQCVAI